MPENVKLRQGINSGKPQKPRRSQEGMRNFRQFKMDA